MWEYRVIKIIGETTLFEIRSVYINFENKIQYVAQSQAHMKASTFKELAILNARLEIALQKPIIVFDQNTHELTIGSKNVGYVTSSVNELTLNVKCESV